MSAISEKMFEKYFFIFVKGRLFLMGGFTDMNVSVFWKTSAVFLKNV